MEFTADDIFREIYELQEIINFILSESKDSWSYILMPEKSMENIYENVFEGKERILNNAYFGEYKKPKEPLAKNEVRTRIKKEYDESYKEKTINTENMVLKTIKETESNINNVFKNMFDEKENFLLYGQYQKNVATENKFKSIFSNLIYGEENQRFNAANMFFKNINEEKNVFERKDEKNFLSEENIRNIFKKNEDKRSYEFKDILKYVKSEEKIQRQKRQINKDEESKKINITFNNYNNEYGKTDENRIINSIAEKIMEYAQCGAEGVHI